MVSHVCKLVQFQLVRFILLVGAVDMHDIFLEHIEPLVLLIETPGHCVMAPPLLVQIPQAFVGHQVLLVEIKTLNHPKKQSKRTGNQ